VVYRTQYLQAVSEQCCTCKRAPCLPWLPHNVPRALLTPGNNRVTAYGPPQTGCMPRRPLLCYGLLIAPSSWPRRHSPRGNNALSDYRRVFLRTGIGYGRICPNHSAISPSAYDRHEHGNYAAGAPELVYKGRQNTLPAVPEQCCTCRRAPCLPWLPDSLPVTFLTRGDPWHLGDDVRSANPPST
jgi:hypothetical protein